MSYEVFYISQGKFWTPVKEKTIFAVSVDGELIRIVENVWPTRRHFKLFLSDARHISAGPYGKMTNLKVYPFGYPAWI